MKLTDIPLTDMHAGKSWFVSFPEGGDPNNPEVQEEDNFAEGDLGLFSAILKFADGSNHPALVLIFDAGNIVTQGCSASEVFAQYQAMKPGLGWMHIKDYRHPSPAKRTTHVDEEALKHFVPADIGDSGHEAILRDFATCLPKLEAKLQRRGIPGVFLDLEPHVKGGGQFGGFSGPDGMGVALRGLCRVLDYVGIQYHLRDFADIVADRGF